MKKRNLNGEVIETENSPNVCPECGNDTFVTTEVILAKYIFENGRFEWLGDDSTGCDLEESEQFYTCDFCGEEIDFAKSENKNKIVVKKRKK